ncbi:MAB_1171c family putative transporter [Amycolatopsis magusensis]|uniref:MAB_1171c family putative transporter n=1 Tax=Amycolatopsis magusensis TaxID=882444 RepID=UPI003788101E
MRPPPLACLRTARPRPILRCSTRRSGRRRGLCPGVTSALTYLCSLGALLAAVTKLRLPPGGSSTASRRYLAAALATLSLSVAMSAPATLALAAEIEPIPNGAQLLAHSLTMLSAFCALGMIEHAVAQRGPRRVAVRAATLVLCAAAMTFLLFTADIAHHGDLANAYGHYPVILTYFSLYLGYLSWSLGRFVWLMHRYTTTHQAQPLMRHGFQLTVLGAGIGLFWVLWQITGLVAAAAGHHVAPDAISDVLAGAAVVTGAAGATLASWMPVVLALPRWLRAELAHRRLRMMWSELLTAVPHVAFDAAGVTTALRRAERAEYKLYRRIVEIRDAELALRPHAPPEARSKIQAAAEAHGAGEPEVLIEAAELGIALDARQTKQRRPACPAPPVPAERLVEPPDLLREAAWLARVSTALHRSDLVAEVRAEAAQAWNGTAAHE